ncbi:hypothetical protein PINS_up007902 [Pythium insidiosum]|nr:hypothetical protein PINS_up007902 [Pythium insidiosum]
MKASVVTKVALCAAAVGATAFVIRRVAGIRLRGRYTVKRATLAAFRADTTTRWVALCGTLFDVSGDPFFAEPVGVYSSWAYHDVTAALLHQADYTCAEESASNFDQDVDAAALFDETSSIGGRQREVLKEWYSRLTQRYRVIGQLSELFVSDEWNALREECLPSSWEDRSRGSCPLGFGSSRVVERVIEEDRNPSGPRREVTFLGRRYDVTDSPLFSAPDGPFAHLVGHDITVALATRSARTEDLNSSVHHEFTYEEQVRLEQYRRLFASELRMISEPSESTTTATSSDDMNLHTFLDAGDFNGAKQVLEDHATSVDINSVCPRTGLTLLHRAIERNDIELAQLLVRLGADVTAPAALYDDETATALAVRFGNEAMIKLFRHEE